MESSADLLELLRRDGLVRGQQPRLTPLTGGVSSEIYLVEDGAERFVVKRALPKLKVKADWFADTTRNLSEHRYIQLVSNILPESVPRLRFANPEAGYFAMDYLGQGFANWKRLLLDGTFSRAAASTAGRILGTIHGETAQREDLRLVFDTTVNFHQLRLAPYLLATGERHPEFGEIFQAESERLAHTRECLVHGDFSPKNILVQKERLVLLDCEVAWYGDPIFDVAFLLNHFFLKALYHAPKVESLAMMVEEFLGAYGTARRQPSTVYDQRLVRLLPLLLLARIDGKSPVEYLNAQQADFVREFVLCYLRGSSREWDEFNRNWFEETKRLTESSRRI